MGIFDGLPEALAVDPRFVGLLSALACVWISDALPRIDR